MLPHRQATFFSSTNTRSQKQWTQEFNLIGSIGDKFDFVTGVFYFTETSKELNPQYPNVVIRDKIAASKKKGLWMGGPVPLGYQVMDRKLVVNEAEAETVRFIYNRYLALGTVPVLIDDLQRRGIRTKVQIRASGPHRGGIMTSSGW